MLRFATEILAACSCALVAASVAIGHPVAILIGEAKLDAHSLVIKVEPADADLEHLGIDPADPQAARALRSVLAAGLVVVDDRGDRIAPGGADITGVRLDYALRPEAAAASLWVDPASTLARRGVQLHLARVDGGGALRLAPGGNAATVLVAPRPVGVGPVDAWRDRHRFERLHATVDASDGRVRIDVVAPVSIVETWIPLPRESPYAIDPDRAAPALEAFAGIVRDAVAVGGASPMIERVRLLRPDEGVESAPAARAPVSAAGACVLVRLGGFAAGDEIELEWRLFNAAIRRVDLKGAQPPFDERSATPYSPVTTWPAD